jgi:hypothetical protein
MGNRLRESQNPSVRFDCARPRGNSDGGGLFRHLSRATLVATVLLVVGCGALNLGKAKWIEKTDKDEHYYLLKDVFLTSGSAAHARETFDHQLHEVANLVFIPKNEKNSYIAESRWYDPNGVEFRTIRTTHDKQAEGKQGIERPQSGGTTRIHSIPIADLFAHKPGLWKVVLYLDGKLARRLSFSVI